MKDIQTDKKLDTVPEKARRAREIRYDWVERRVWTERMLCALDNGVKGGKWYSLMDKVKAPETLRLAFAKVKANRGSAGIDGISISRFEKRLKRNLESLQKELESKSFQPQPVKRMLIDKPGSREKRPLGIPTVRDRVVQTALKMVMEPIFEAEFHESSYGFRPRRGCKDALRAVNRKLRSGYRWVVDADFRKFFDTIPKERLLERVKESISDQNVLNLIESYLNQEVIHEMERWTPEAGTPQGAIISPLLANVYLNPLDHQLAEAGLTSIRYADDLIIIAKTEDEAKAGLELLEKWTVQEGLSLHPDKTCLVEMNHPRAGFDFLGFHFQVSKKGPEIINRWPSRKNQKRLREKIRPLTKRCNGRSLDELVVKINRILKGWFNYFQHSRSSEFPGIDGWIRMRLRSILRKRRKGRGRGRGMDHHRWPNAYFSKLGLFSTEIAHQGLLARPRRR